MYKQPQRQQVQLQKSQTSERPRNIKVFSRPTHFIPLAMKILGPINETGITFVADIGRLLTQATDEARETSFIFQILSVTIQRFNAVAFAGTLSAPLPEFEQRLFERLLHQSR